MGIIHSKKSVDIASAKNVKDAKNAPKNDVKVTEISTDDVKQEPVKDVNTEKANGDGTILNGDAKTPENGTTEEKIDEKTEKPENGEVKEETNNKDENKEEEKETSEEKKDAKKKKKKKSFRSFSFLRREKKAKQEGTNGEVKKDEDANTEEKGEEKVESSSQPAEVAEEKKEVEAPAVATTTEEAKDTTEQKPLSSNNDSVSMESNSSKDYGSQSTMPLVEENPTSNNKDDAESFEMVPSSLPKEETVLEVTVVDKEKEAVNEIVKTTSSIIEVEKHVTISPANKDGMLSSKSENEAVQEFQPLNEHKTETNEVQLLPIDQKIIPDIETRHEVNNLSLELKPVSNEIVSNEKFENDDGFVNISTIEAQETTRSLENATKQILSTEVKAEDIEVADKLKNDSVSTLEAEQPPSKENAADNLSNIVKNKLENKSESQSKLDSVVSQEVSCSVTFDKDPSLEPTKKTILVKDSVPEIEIVSPSEAKEMIATEELLLNIQAQPDHKDATPSQATVCEDLVDSHISTKTEDTVESSTQVLQTPIEKTPEIITESEKAIEELSTEALKPEIKLVENVSLEKSDDLLTQTIEPNITSNAELKQDIATGCPPVLDTESLPKDDVKEHPTKVEEVAKEIRIPQITLEHELNPEIKEVIEQPINSSDNGDKSQPEITDPCLNLVENKSELNVDSKPEENDSLVNPISQEESVPDISQDISRPETDLKENLKSEDIEFKSDECVSVTQFIVEKESVSECTKQELNTEIKQQLSDESHRKPCEENVSNVKLEEVPEQCSESQENHSINTAESRHEEKPLMPHPIFEQELDDVVEQVTSITEITPNPVSLPTVETVPEQMSVPLTGSVTEQVPGPKSPHVPNGFITLPVAQPPPVPEVFVAEVSPKVEVGLVTLTDSAKSSHTEVVEGKKPEEKEEAVAAAPAVEVTEEEKPAEEAKDEQKEEEKEKVELETTKEDTPVEKGEVTETPEESSGNTEE